MFFGFSIVSSHNEILLFGMVWSGVVVACFQFRIRVLQPAGVLLLLVVIGKVAAVVAVVG